MAYCNGLAPVVFQVCLVSGFSSAGLGKEDWSACSQRHTHALLHGITAYVRRMHGPASNICRHNCWWTTAGASPDPCLNVLLNCMPLPFFWLIYLPAVCFCMVCAAPTLRMRRLLRWGSCSRRYMWASHPSASCLTRQPKHVASSGKCAVNRSQLRHASPCFRLYSLQHTLSESGSGRACTEKLLKLRHFHTVMVGPCWTSELRKAVSAAVLAMSASTMGVAYAAAPCTTTPLSLVPKNASYSICHAAGL
jgi:hypothetical protein